MELLLLRIAIFSLIFVFFQGTAVAGPVALPEAAPAPEASPEPTASPEAAPKFVQVLQVGDEELSIEELGVRQSYYAFSGAIYIVGPGGVEFTAAEPAECPAEAPQGCSNINVYNCCCASGYSCSMLSNGVVGCCPSGSTCEGTVNAAQITTVTVTQYLTTTQYSQPPTTVVQIGSMTTSTVVPGIYVSVSTTNPPIVYNGYCSTLVANGPDLPTTAQGTCGTILIISRANMQPIGWKLPVLITAFYGVLGLCSCFGFRWRS